MIINFLDVEYDLTDAFILSQWKQLEKYVSQIKSESEFRYQRIRFLEYELKKSEAEKADLRASLAKTNARMSTYRSRSPMINNPESIQKELERVKVESEYRFLRIHYLEKCVADSGKESSGLRKSLSEFQATKSTKSIRRNFGDQNQMKLRLMVNQGNLAREKLEKEVSRSRLEQARLNSMLVKAETSVENCRKHHSTSGVSLELEKTRAQLAFANGLISSYAGMNDQRILQQQQLQQQQHMWTTEKKMQNQEAVSILVNQSSSKSMIISPRIKTGVNNLAVLDADAVATAAKSDAKGNVDIASMVKPASAVVTDPVDAPLIFNTRNVKGEVKHTPISKKKKMMIKSGGEMSGSLNTFVFMCASIKREREEQGETWEVKYDEKNQIRTKAFTQKRIKTASIDGGGEIHKQFQQLRLDGTETQSSPPPVNQILVTPTIYVGSG